LELRDLVITPLLLIMVGVAAILLRPFFTDEVTRRYFIPALWCKIIGALALGFIYQFYYSGGDTFTYHTHGSRVIWEVFMDSPSKGLKLLTLNGEFGPGLWDVAEKIWYWRDPKSFFVIRIAFLFDLLTFSTYSATAVLFSLVSFIGGWMLFTTFYKIYPTLHRWLALSCLFIPSIIFWGSGILKDTLTLAFLGSLTFSFYRLFIERKISFFGIFLFVLSFYLIFSIKKYIVIGFVAAALVWFFSANVNRIKNATLRFIMIPFALLVCLMLGYLSINKVVEDDPQYALDRIAATAKITAYDIRYGWGVRDGDGSGYNLGELDGTFTSIVRLAPQAVNVTLFRPYFWEITNPLMVLSAVEGFATLVFTMIVLFSVRLKIVRYLKAEVVFCLIFAFIFALGVGISTYNFGTLSRYKIPLLPFYWSALAMIYSLWRLEKTNYKSITDLN
jgi:hypothetical protein